MTIMAAPHLLAEKTNVKGRAAATAKMKNIKMRRLQSYNFCRTSVSCKVSPRQQADSDSIWVDYSGTYVSPAP
jgi:hypothetical protein